MFYRDRIIKLLEEKGWTKYKLAKEANIPQSSLHDILSGKIKSPTIERAKAIADALGVTVDEFLDQDDIKEPENIDIPQEYTDKYKVTPRDKKQYEAEMKKANEAFFLNDELSEDAKKEMLDLMSELFWKAKAANKRKPKDK